MNADSTSQLDAPIEQKKQKIQQLNDEARSAPAVAAEPAIAITTALYDQYQKGEFRNIGRIRVRWLPPGPQWTGPDMFEFIPKRHDPFQFITPGGETVTPRTMYTDIGSIPRAVGLFIRGLTPWGYAPAYLVHDWEFELHHCGRTPHTFDQVRDIMMQGVKTLMEEKICPKNIHHFWLLYEGINSFVAKNYWNRNPPKCTLPPDNPE